jgi:hypothetical protein
MKRLLTTAVLIAAALALAAAGLADPGDKGKGKKQGKNKFSFQLVNTDNRCDGTPGWATLNETRTYQVHDNGNGTFRLRRVDKGTFTTIAGTSPGNCVANKSKHGHLVRAGVTGRFGGYLEGTVKATTFNKNATCAATGCFTTEFLQAFFNVGPDAFSCNVNSSDCKFNFNYTASNRKANRPRLIVRHWQDRGKGAGSMLQEVFHGDIASS